jgi:hypothetical protein
MDSSRRPRRGDARADAAVTQAKLLQLAITNNFYPGIIFRKKKLTRGFAPMLLF